MDEKGKQCRKLSESETIQLVTLYKNCECLWNYASEDYKNKNKRNKCYEHIREELKLGSVCEVKRKIKSIRDTFTAEKNKIKKSNKSGAGADDVYKTKLSWYNLASSFLLKSGGRSSCNNLSADIEETSLFEDIEETSFVTNELNSENAADTDICSELNIRESKKEEELECPIKKKKKVNKSDVPDYINTALSKLEELKKNTNQDEFYYFGQAIACQLRTLPKESAARLQAEIQNLVSQKIVEFLSTTSRTERCSTSLSSYSCRSLESSSSSKGGPSMTPDNILEEAMSMTFGDSF